MEQLWRNGRRTITRLSALVVLLSLIAACGGAPAAQNPTAAPAAPTAAPAAPTAAPEPTSAPEPTAAPEPTSAPEPTAAPVAQEPNASAGNPEPGTPGGTM